METLKQPDTALPQREVDDDPRIVLAHGGGGELTKRLLEKHVLPKLANPMLNPLTDAAMLPSMTGQVCFSTDSFVVQPLFFPGADIGRLAVCGTVNDVAVMGAEVLALSLALVIEEGLLLASHEMLGVVHRHGTPNLEPMPGDELLWIVSKPETRINAKEHGR